MQPIEENTQLPRCEGRRPIGQNQDPADEMADVLWVLLCLANQTGVDLTDALRKNIEKKTSRDKDRHKNNPKLQ